MLYLGIEDPIESCIIGHRGGWNNVAAAGTGHHECSALGSVRLDRPAGSLLPRPANGYVNACPAGCRRLQSLPAPDRIVDRAKGGGVLSALKYRNFRLFFFGQSISLIGTWMQQTAMIWLIYRMTHSPFLLGLVGFCSQIPSFFLAPLAGVYTDRWNLHRTIVATQCLAMLQAAIFVVLTFTGKIAVWQIVLLSLFMGLVNAFDIPARQSFLIQMVEGREGLAGAIGLNSSMFNAAQLVGPAIAGFLIAAVGEAACFLLNALSYLAVLAALLAMRLPPRSPAKPPQHVLHELKEGFRYAFGFPPIRDILLLLTVVNLVATPLRVVLLPIFATTVLHGQSRTLGLLMSAVGLGALAGALVLASRKTVLGLGRQIAWAGAAFGLSLLVFSHVRRPVDFVADPGGRRIHPDDRNGLQQHDPANDRRRRQARPGDELLRHGLPRRGPAGEPGGRGLGQSSRR